jgi:hypothetical protein
MKTIRVRITFTEEALGTASGDRHIHEEFIASKAPDAKSIEEEVASIGTDAVIEKGKTVYSRNMDGQPIMWDYQIKGFFKEACSVMSRIPDTLSSKVKAHKKVIDGLVFPRPRQLLIHFIEGASVPVGDCQRPLRAQTAQGERIALANSETVPVGSWFETDIVLLDDRLEKVLLEWLDYGQWKGLGCWRNSGKGRLAYEVLEKSEQPGINLVTMKELVETAPLRKGVYHTPTT